MSDTRLFIGGLSSCVTKEVLSSRLKDYGNVISVDVKEKTDKETGEIIKKFAFVTLQTEPSALSQCIHELNGAELGGGIINVQQAQESFIDRLKREREERNLPAKQEPAIPSYSGTFSQLNTIKSNDFECPPCGIKTQETTINRFSDQSYFKGNYQTSFNKETLSPQDQEGNPNLIPLGGIEDNAAIPRIPFKQPQKKQRYDPSKVKTAVTQTPPAVNQSQIGSLSFTGASSSFSLLEMFKQEAKNEVAEVQQKPAVIADPRPTPVNDYKPKKATDGNKPPPKQVKSAAVTPSPKKFFVNSTDTSVIENLHWAYQLMPSDAQATFLKDRPQIVEHFKQRRRVFCSAKRYAEKTEERKMGTTEDRDGEMVKVMEAVKEARLLSDEIMASHNNYDEGMKRILDVIEKQWTKEKHNADKDDDKKNNVPQLMRHQNRKQSLKNANQQKCKRPAFSRK